MPDECGRRPASCSQEMHLQSIRMENIGTEFRYDTTQSSSVGVRFRNRQAQTPEHAHATKHRTPGAEFADLSEPPRKRENGGWNSQRGCSPAQRSVTCDEE